VGKLRLAEKAVALLDKLLNICIGLMLIVALLYSGDGLWDTWHIYDKADIGSELKALKPNENAQKFAQIYEINSDICAWLTVDGTSIDYPVVQGDSNLEYINKDVYGEFSLSGSVFLDYLNQNDFSDYYSLTYAHHMEGAVMFGELPNFMESDFFEENTTGTLYLQDHTYRIEWFACDILDAYDRNVFKPSEIETKEDYNNLLEYIRDNAIQYRDINVEESSHIIGLSTCLDSTTNGRVMLFGKLTEDNGLW
jgi:sortase B